MNPDWEILPSCWLTPTIVVIFFYFALGPKTLRHASPWPRRSIFGAETLGWVGVEQQTNNCADFAQFTCIFARRCSAPHLPEGFFGPS